MRENVSAEYTNTFLRLVNAARLKSGLPPLFWAKSERPDNLTELPQPEHIKRIYHELKHCVFRVFQRWERADLLAVDGQDWTGHYNELVHNRPWVEPDVHASYRGIAEQIGHPCPSQNACLTELNLASTGLTRDLFTGVFGLYPSKPDVQNILMLFLLRTGWNGAAVMNMDATVLENCLITHPTSPIHHIVFAVKDRGYTEQSAMGLEKSSLALGNLIRALWMRTEPLRNQLRKELENLEKEPVSEENEKRISEFRRRIRSPWLYVSSRDHNEINALNVATYGTGADREGILRTLIRGINAASPDKEPISTALTLADFRDAYISFAYETSGYSWLVAQLAAGHSSVESLKTYLRKTRWKAHGERKYGLFQKAMWDEILLRRVVDPAVLFAMVQRGTITDEQRKRWEAHKDRTRVGTGCKDFKEIAPHHIEGSGCRVQRCTLCKYALVFDDSLPHLARRLAELEYVKTTVPLVSWTESSFPDEVDATELTLSQCFEVARVSEQIAFWRAEIATGRHIPLQMEGEYGS